MVGARSTDLSLDVTLDLATMPAVDVSAEEPELAGPGDSLGTVDDT